MTSLRVIGVAKEFMDAASIDGWLLRDYRYTNPVFHQVIGKRVSNLTRPVWLMIPAHKPPHLLAHSVDVGRFTKSTLDIPDIDVYRNRDEMVRGLDRLVDLCRSHSSKPVIAMEYSPMSELPRVGRVDAGSIELVRSLDVEVVPSGDITQYATERWSEAQLKSHRYAAEELTKIVQEAFQFIGEEIRWQLTEHDVAEFIRGRLERTGLESDDGPVVAFGANSADPHYEPTPDDAALIRRNGWLLIDLWARQKKHPSKDEHSIYADITWVANLGNLQEERQRNVFNVVRDARDAAFEFVVGSVEKGRHPQGWEVDRAAREVVDKAGYGHLFVHRLGHSLGREVHANGVNLDSWETHDTRTLIDGIGVTIEPGVYLPGEFGVRLEMDVYMSPNSPEITTPPQNKLISIETD